MAKKEEVKKEEVSTGAEEMISVKKEDLDSLIKRVEKLSKDNETLFQVADKARLASVANRNPESIIKKYGISKWRDNDQFIVGWKLTKNISEIVPGSNRWVEDQATMLVFEDGSTLEVPLIDFYRKRIKTIGDLVSQTQTFNEKTKEPTVVFTIEFPDGKRLSVDQAFIN